jgi:N-acetylglucosaminyl-diphospho-decaprenol L-rhamnosyltransferase
MRSSVVVVSLQPGDWLVEALASVVAQADQVVLVDNGSTDGEASAIGRHAGVSVVRSHRNLGFAAGVNLGVRHASGDLLALLNDDAVAAPDWISRSADALAAPDVAAVTPKVLYRQRYQAVRIDTDAWQAPGDDRVLGAKVTRAHVDGRDVLGGLCGPGIHRMEVDDAGERWRWSCPGEPVYVPVPGPGAEIDVEGGVVEGPVLRLVNKAGSWLSLDGILGDAGDREPDDGRFDTSGEHFFASGTALVTRADTWAHVGGLAEPLFAYFEDGDWSWRARLAGMRIVYDPTGVVEHRQSATSGGWNAQWVRRWVPANHAACLLRNAPLGQAWPAVRRHLQGSDPDGSRFAILSRVPWALRSRLSLAKGWQLGPGEVWERWAGLGAPPLPTPTPTPTRRSREPR